MGKYPSAGMYIYIILYYITSFVIYMSYHILLFYWDRARGCNELNAQRYIRAQVSAEVRVHKKRQNQRWRNDEIVENQYRHDTACLQTIIFPMLHNTILYIMYTSPHPFCRLCTTASAIIKNRNNNYTRPYGFRRRIDILRLERDISSSIKKLLIKKKKKTHLYIRILYVV